MTACFQQPFCQEFCVTKLFSEMIYVDTEIIPKDLPRRCTHKEQECFHKISLQGQVHLKQIKQFDSCKTIPEKQLPWLILTGRNCWNQASSRSSVSENSRQEAWCPGVHVCVQLPTWVPLARPHLWFGPHSILFFSKTKWSLGWDQL